LVLPAIARPVTVSGDRPLSGFVRGWSDANGSHSHDSHPPAGSAAPALRAQLEDLRTATIRMQRATGAGAKVDIP